MENINKKENEGDKNFTSIKASTNNNIGKNIDNNNGISVLSITESNNLMLNEANDNKEKEFNSHTTLNDLLKKYLNTPKNNNISLKNTSNHLFFPKILDIRDLTFESEFYDNFNFCQTIALYKEGSYSQNINKYKKCRLIIKEDYLYVLNYNKRTYNSSKDYIVNPENSFLIKIERDKNISEQDKKYIKYDYELSRPLLCLNFNLITCILLINKNYLNEFTILILGTNKKYSFIIDDKHTKEKFCYLIGNLIYNSKDNKCDLVLHNKNFYKQTYITPDDFEILAKTGDLILFKTRHILANFQRFFTCDNYDHIGFIHSNFGFISIFDSSKMGDCKEHYFGAFKTSLNNLTFEKICYRRLNIEEKNYEKKMKIQENIEKITEQFMSEVTGKKYYLSIYNILFKGKPKNYEIKGEWEKAKGFSCSSLVAALYVKLGIIKLKNSIDSIKPGDFEQNKNLYFLPGYSLGPEKIIQFSG